MRRIISIIIALMLCASSGFAKTPPEILEPYQEYRTQLEAEDYSSALRSAKKSWMRSEKFLGDSKITGDLAQNYGLLAVKLEKRDAVRAFVRATELARFYDEDQRPSIYLDRKLTTIKLLNNIDDKTTKIHLDAAGSYLAQLNLTGSTYAAELLTEKARYELNQGNIEKALEYGLKALEVLAHASDELRTSAPIVAKKIVGKVLEEQDKPLMAIEYYQAIIQELGQNEHGRGTEDYQFAFMRWLRIRNFYRKAGKLEEAENAGLCRCWPYDKPRNETIKPIFERTNNVSRKFHAPNGFAIFEFDINAQGETENIRVLLKSGNSKLAKIAESVVRKSKYASLKEDESIAVRKNVVRIFNSYRRGNSASPQWGGNMGVFRKGQSIR